MSILHTILEPSGLRYLQGLGAHSLESMSTAKCFFADVPWGTIPPHRKSEMIHVSTLPRIGLLGGSARPSKLAALAASRKKQNEEKKKDDQRAQIPEAERAVSLLDRLAAQRNSATPFSNTSASSRSSERLRLTAALRTKKIIATEPSDDDETEETIEPTTEEPLLPIFKADPSVFAKALCGVNESYQDGATLPTIQDKGASKMLFSLPYTFNQTYMHADPFAEPSPDDVILAAQSKGSLHS